MAVENDWLGLSGKTVVVTGAAGGIGFGIAECFVAAGSSVLLLDNDATACEAAAERLGGAKNKVFARACDVSKAEQVKAAAAYLLEVLGPCDVLVNNAGILRPGAFATLALEDWQKLLDVNLTGPFLCSQTFGAHMLARRKGSIVHIASIAARFPQSFSGAYSASKAGIVLLSQGLATEWGPMGIRSNCVSPGNTRSGMTQPILAVEGVEASRVAMMPLRRIADPSDMGEVVLFLASERAGYVTGENISVDGGYARTILDLLPRHGYTRDEVAGPPTTGR
jgi:glucose 1-dehydrogenase